MKKALLGGVFFFAVMVLGAQDANPGLKTILNNWGERNYAAGEVAAGDLDLMLQAGVRAPSAGNRQPWHFTVVKDAGLAGKIISGVTAGNVLVVISAEKSQEPGVALDCALAAENIYLAAQALGYGSRLYTGPVAAINKSLKKDLALPPGHNAVIVVRVGRLPPSADAISGASPRNEAGKTITYK